MNSTHKLLAEVANGTAVTQRGLSRNAGIALGLTNLLIRRMARKGWVRVIRIKRNRVRYLITPAGLAEKARMARRSLATNIRFYSEARDRIAERFRVLSLEWPATGGADKRIVFCNAGEVAEIGFVCLYLTDLKLMGVVDAERRGTFLGFDVQGFEALAPGRLGAVAFDQIVAMSFDEAEGEALAQRLAERGYSAERVFWV